MNKSKTSPCVGRQVEILFTSTFSSDIIILDTVHSIIRPILVALGLDEDSMYAINSSVHEILVNAVKHGNGKDPEKKVRLVLRSFEEMIFITIEDEGSGFYLRNIPDPTKPENLEKPNGRGLFHARKFMDSVVCCTVMGSRFKFRVLISKRLPKKGEGGKDGE